MIMSQGMWEGPRLPKAAALAASLAHLFPLEIMKLFAWSDQ